MTTEIKAPVGNERNLFAVEHRVKTADHWNRTGHKGGVLWLTGLSGSGKTTLALALEQKLHQLGWQTYVLDGDNIRGGLNKDLGFSPEDRTENIRRIGEVAALFAQSGTLVITAFISPYIEDRNTARQILPEQFHEVYIQADLDTCEARDPKGLYKKARAGQIPEFTGISAPYEAPEAPDLVVDTAALSEQESLDALVNYVRNNFALQDRLRAVA